MSTSFEASRAQATLRYCGRDFSPGELDIIRRIADDPHQPTRAEIARAVCDALHWLQPDSRPKVMSCCPARLRCSGWGRTGSSGFPSPRARSRGPGFSEASAPAAPITGTLADLGPVRVDPVGHHAARRPGALPGLCRRSPAAALGFGAAAWSVAPRDRHIGWTRAEREAHLPSAAHCTP